MFVRVLGSAAGGGFPQWNCNCRNCASVRANAPHFRARTQSSLAVSANGQDWALLNASPDLRQQIADCRALQPSAGSGNRASPIKAVVVTNADVDHIAGLINLREAQPFTLYGTDRVLDVIAGSAVFNILAHDVVSRVPLTLDEPTELHNSGRSLGLTVEAFAVPGKIALYLEDISAGPSLGSEIGDTIGLRVRNTGTGASVLYIPGCSEVDDTLRERIRGANALFFDGTLYDDDEMIRQGLLQKTGVRMGHINIAGPKGSIAELEPLEIDRKIYVHINNSNPVLDESSAQRRATEAAGWEIGYDGMEVRL